MTNLKTALITGASRGIGKAIMEKFAQNNFFCVGTATTDEGSRSISDLLEQTQSLGFGHTLNVNKSEMVDQLFDKLNDKNLLPDVLVLNAGITADNLFIKMTQDEWSTVLQTNLHSAFSITQKFLKPMLRNRLGRIIIITSVVGVSGNPGQVNYAASKAGIIGFAKSLALEIASRNITVNCISPGFIESDMTNSLTELQKQKIISMVPMGRMGKADDIASIALFLASNHASYITGETIQCNGGLYCQ
ncbi:MAG: 3-oxoacyl-[acyl-carrier-protein] reductase [Methylacidiphilales bacterium]|nr:3-oxoacyl-[acyl-carrier-protein] reductase [Candidatus Methylacidiphilales bacterium]